MLSKKFDSYSIERSQKILKHDLDIKNTEDKFFKEKSTIIFDQAGLKIYHNDFLQVDLSEYKGKINLLVTSPPYNVSIEYGSFNDNLD